MEINMRWERASEVAFEDGDFGVERQRGLFVALGR